jgi:hypothetical protein
MSDSRADIVTSASMAPSSASEKFARLQLIEKQLDYRNSTDPVKKALLGNFSELDGIRMDVMLAIADYKESTPEWYQLRALTGGLEDPFDQAEYLAKTIYDAQKMDLMMSYYTPSKSSIRDKFVENAQKGNQKRAGVLASEASRLAAKTSVLSRAASAASSALLGPPRSASASGGSSG